MTRPLLLAILLMCACNSRRTQCHDEATEAP